jgi:tRNA dimethylallyltransferase
VASKAVVACIVGPTACGKNDLALALAVRNPVHVINLDSRQVYRDFPIITSQPTPEEQAVCPHRLYGFLGLTETIHAGRYVELAREAVGEALRQGGLPVLVGGTGMYLRSLRQGLAPIPPIPDGIHSEILKDLERTGPAALHGELERIDPAAAARIHPNDRQRIARALEVYRATGQPISWWREKSHQPPAYDYRLFGLDMDKAELHRRIEWRVEAMLEAGALDEARAARKLCDDPEAPGWTGIGCAEILAHLRGEATLEEASASWSRNTKAYAKRQMTWFRKEPDIQWLPASDIAAAVARVQASL